MIGSAGCKADGVIWPTRDRRSSAIFVPEFTSRISLPPVSPLESGNLICRFSGTIVLEGLLAGAGRVAIKLKKPNSYGG
jgi:hypothetical protein